MSKLTLRRRKGPGTAGDLVAISEPNIILIDSESSNVTRIGTWSRVEESEAVGGSYLQSNTANSKLTFSFKGSTLWIRFRFGPDCGKVKVEVDSLSVTIDLYHALELYKYVNVAVGLKENETHNVTLTVLGEKNASSTDYYVKVDSFAYRLTEEALSLHSIEYIDLINVINTINRINQIELINNIANVQKIGEVGTINPASAFSHISTVPLDGDEINIYALAISPPFLYAGCWRLSSPAKIVKMTIPALKKVATLDISGVGGGISSLVISGNYLYAGLHTSPGRILKIDLSTFTHISTLTLATGEDYVTALAEDGSYLYAGLETSPGKVVKIDLSTFTPVETLTFNTGEDNVKALQIRDGFLYAGLYTSPGKIVKINLSTSPISRVSTLTFDADEDYVMCLTSPEETILCAGLATSPGKIVVIDLPTFTKGAVITLGSDEKQVCSLASRGRYIYAGLATAPAKIVQVDWRMLTTTTLTLPIGTGAVRSEIIYRDYLFAGLETEPGNIAKITLEDLDVIINTINEIGTIADIGSVSSIGTIDLIKKVKKAVVYGNTSPDGTGTDYALKVDSSGNLHIRPLSEITDSVRISGDFSSTATVKKYLPLTQVSAGGTVDLWVPSPGKQIRLKRFQISVSGATAVTLQWSGATAVTDFETYNLPDKGCVVVNLVGCNEEAPGPDYVLRLKSSATAFITAKVSGEED